MNNTDDTRDITHASGLLADFLTEPELAQELNVCQMTVRRWRSMGEGPPVTRIGRRVLFRHDAVRSWLASRQIDPEAA